MNCKPGDLAIVVQSDYPETIGRLCLVLKSHDIDEDGWSWLCQFASPTMWQDVDSGEDVSSRNGYILDAWLRPIRDPGDDATDETLLWLPTPLRNRETA